MKKLLRRAFSWHSSKPKPTISFSGPYNSLEAAQAASTGYDSISIAEAIVAAMKQVRCGAAAMERDGFALTKPQYPYQLLASLLSVAGQNGNDKLVVLDFGGSLGSSFFACKPWLGHIRSLSWTVVEQSHLVHIGNERFSDHELKFIDSLNTVSCRPDVVLASGVLMFLSDPYAILDQLLSFHAEMCVLDRTAIVPTNEDVIAVEHVRSESYEASYPIRFLSYPRLTGVCRRHYDCIEEFAALDKFSVPFADLNFIGLILRLKKAC